MIFTFVCGLVHAQNHHLNMGLSAPKFFNNSGRLDHSKANRTGGCPMWALSGPNLALHNPYLPTSAFC